MAGAGSEIRGEAPSGIVVGVDGSDSAKAALAWAVRQALLTGASLQVVISWEIPTTYGWVTPLPEDLDFEADARRIVTATVAEVVGSEEPGNLDLTLSIVEGHPAAVLLRESQQAALVVVGSRGHGSFSGMLLGSVGLHLATHAHCPVVIVRDGEELLARQEESDFRP
ncbi:MAG: universal stress protein [Actinomycetota bacterium]|nr:universal stress protein [Actinomycetota bacterium]